MKLYLLSVMGLFATLLSGQTQADSLAKPLAEIPQ
jgi:hypothetical protein